jgi:dihydrofolate synthase/folylpolyglutamate synthase
MSSLATRLEQQQKLHPSAIDLTLARVREVAARMGLLDRAQRASYRAITVAGTNGKGSTVAYLDALLRAAGKRSGRFTSPHLRRYNERIAVDGVDATDDELLACFDRVDAARGEITLTFFEYNALAALDHFRQREVEFAVLEVGLGGRLDATNIIDADVAVVCSIGIDHADWLGGTLAEIGREKAGIFRAGRPAVFARADLPYTVGEVAGEVGARPVIAGRDFAARTHANGWDFEMASLQLTDLPPPGIAGTQQVANAAAALAALVCAGALDALDASRVATALTHTQLPGRFQIVPGEVEWVLDVAHNVPAAEALAANLRTLERRRTLAVCGILGDKDIRGIAEAVSEYIDAWCLVALEGPRAVSLDELASRLPAGAVVVNRASDVAAACRVARAAASPGDRIVVFGSFLTVGPALDFLAI